MKSSNKNRRTCTVHLYLAVDLRVYFSWFSLQGEWGRWGGRQLARLAAHDGSKAQTLFPAARLRGDYTASRHWAPAAKSWFSSPAGGNTQTRLGSSGNSEEWLQPKLPQPQRHHEEFSHVELHTHEKASGLWCADWEARQMRTVRQKRGDGGAGVVSFWIKLVTSSELFQPAVELQWATQVENNVISTWTHLHKYEQGITANIQMYIYI